MSPEKTKSNPLGAGRNPRADKAAESRVVIRLTEAEHTRYKAAAENEALPLASWIRAACEAQLPKKKRSR